MEDSALLIPVGMAKNLPAMVRNELAKMNAIKQEEFVEEYKRKSKSTSKAFLFIFLFGLHYAYMKKWGMQILFWCTGGGFVIWWLIDFFRLSGIVDDHNKDVALEVMRNLKATS